MLRTTIRLGLALAASFGAAGVHAQALAPDTAAPAAAPSDANVSATAERIYANARPSLLQIRTLVEAAGRQSSIGSGFLVSADGLNNELERPHVIRHAGRYYLFWSTQAQVFDPTGPVGPTGLYGMVSERLGGGWKPLNGTGLIFANPPEAPAQAYSWLVLPDLEVASFVDDWGPMVPARPRRFGGTFAPPPRLALDGASARLAG